VRFRARCTSPVFDGHARLWNLREGATGAWLIRRERADGSLEDAGCGAVMVDPLDARIPTPVGAEHGDRRSDTTASSPAGDAILVGDFSSVAAASDASATIGSALGSTRASSDAKTQPAVVRPGCGPC
jgi:hypothetical protein